MGSFEKCWKLRDGKWWMYKKATHDEMFSELFVYELGKALGMNMAIYERGDGCIKSLDFTNAASVNFEPASTFMGDNEDYSDVVKALEQICPKAIPDYIRMIFMDTICANPISSPVFASRKSPKLFVCLSGLAQIVSINMSFI